MQIKKKHQEADNKSIETHNQIYTLSIFGFVILKKKKNPQNTTRRQMFLIAVLSKHAN